MNAAPEQEEKGLFYIHGVRKFKAICFNVKTEKYALPYEEVIQPIIIDGCVTHHVLLADRNPNRCKDDLEQVAFDMKME